jgi:hypothetical protein
MLNELLTLSQPSTNLDHVADDTLAKATDFGGMLSEGRRGLTPRGEGKGRGIGR